MKHVIWSVLQNVCVQQKGCLSSRSKRLCIGNQKLVKNLENLPLFPQSKTLKIHTI